MNRTGKGVADRPHRTASTGPRTSEGKARSSQNARRHGLAAPPPAADDRASGELAARIAAEYGLEPTAVALAEVAASSAMQLHRVRATVTILLQQLSDESIQRALGMRGDHFNQIDELCRLDRYARRATSRLRSALRDLRCGTSRVVPSGGRTL
jgi:hypothetical protein